ncbi:MAG: hypothetical protein L0G23_09450 [Ruaniaceae bacterium]|nr:hypothetical protein [Ruaniaceae bacterium]
MTAGAFLEPEHEENWPGAAEVAGAVVGHLERAAEWLGLGEVSIPDGAPGDGVALLSFALR